MNTNLFHGPSKSNAVASNRKFSKELIKEFINLFGTDSEFELTDNETNETIENTSSTSYEDVLDISIESNLLDDVIDSPKTPKQNLLIKIQNIKSESADDQNKQIEKHSNATQIQSTVPQRTTNTCAASSSSTREHISGQGQRKQQLLDKINQHRIESATNSTEATSKSIKNQSQYWKPKIRSEIYAPKPIQRNNSDSKSQRYNSHRISSHTTRVSKGSTNTTTSSHRSHSHNHIAKQTARYTFKRSTSSVRTHANQLDRTAQANIERNAHNIKRTTDNPFRRSSTSSEHTHIHNRPSQEAKFKRSEQSPQSSHHSHAQAQALNRQAVTSIESHSYTREPSNEPIETQPHAHYSPLQVTISNHPVGTSNTNSSESAYSTQNSIECESQEARIIPLNNKFVPNGVQLAIAVKGKQQLSKNALKKITRNLLAQM